WVPLPDSVRCETRTSLWLVLIHASELLFDAIGTARDFDHSMAEILGTHRVSEERARHDEHRCLEDVVNRDTSISQVRIQPESILVVRRIRGPAHRENGKETLLIVPFGRLDDHFLEPITGKGEDQPVRIAIALYETIQPLGTFADQALRISE